MKKESLDGQNTKEPQLEAQPRLSKPTPVELNLKDVLRQDVKSSHTAQIAVSLGIYPA